MIRKLELLALFLLAVPGWATHTCTTCYISAAGADTNDGTAKTTGGGHGPWLHAPGMPAATSNASTQVPVAGDQYIFRGGDTWHFGNSALSPFVGTTTNQAAWTISTSGTSTDCDMTDNPNYLSHQTTCILYTTDPTYFAGASFARPIFDGDNPITGFPGTISLPSTNSVASCAQPKVGGHNIFVLVGGSFNVLDDIEFQGLCEYDTSSVGTNVANTYVYDQAVGSGFRGANRLSNNFAHGISHPAYTLATCGTPSGMCFNIFFVQGQIGAMSVFGPGNVCDGFDSDPTSWGCIDFGPAYYVYDNVFRNHAQGVLNYCHAVHDNLFVDYYGIGDQIAHGNTMECNNTAPTAAGNSGGTQPNVPFNVFYNNVFSHNHQGANGEEKLQWPPQPGLSAGPFGGINGQPAADYHFNNVFYDQGQGNYFNIGETSPGNWSFTVSSLTASGTTATATTSSAHGYSTGYCIYLTGASPNGYNTGSGGDACATITVTSTTQFTYTVPAGLPASATGSPLASTTHEYLFNNTFEEPATSGTINCTAATQTSVQNHIITESGNGYSGCSSPSGDVLMNHATATTQGYTANGTGTSGGNTNNNSCANDSTPCAPTAVNNGTVNAGAASAFHSYCVNLSNSSAAEIQRAGTACLSETTDGCSYSTSTHVMTCPGQTALVRPVGGSADVGAYQFSAGGGSVISGGAVLSGLVTQ